MDMARSKATPMIGWIDTRETKRYGTRYLARYRHEGRIVPAGDGTYDTEEGALKALAEVHRKMNHGVDPTDGQMTLADYITEVWLPTKRPPATEIRTYTGYESNLRVHIIPRLGHVPLDKLRHSMIQECINQVAHEGNPQVAKNNGTPENAQGVLRVLKMVTKAALVDQRIETNPGAAVKVKRTEADEEKWRIVQPDKIDAFFAALEALEDDKWRLMLLLEMDLGARLAELRGLTPADIDFDACEVTISHTIGEGTRKTLDQIDEWDRWPKGQYRIGANFFYKKTKANRERQIPIDQGTAAALEEWVKQTGIGDDDLLFPSPEGGPLGGSYFHRAVWKPFLRNAKMPDMRVHDLRHTVASYNLDSGEMTWQECMKMMGWSTVAIAQRYTHTLKRPDRKTVAIRNKAYGRPERSLKAV